MIKTVFLTSFCRAFEGRFLIDFASDIDRLSRQFSGRTWVWDIYSRGNSTKIYV